MGIMAILWTQLRQCFNFAQFRKGLGLRIAYVILHLADLLMTVFAANAGFYEMNPFMRELLGSPAQLVTFKLVIPLLIAWLVPARLLIPALILLLAIIGFNVKELLMLVLA